MIIVTKALTGISSRDAKETEAIQVISSYKKVSKKEMYEDEEGKKKTLTRIHRKPVFKTIHKRKYRAEQLFGKCSTPPLICANGDKVYTIDVDEVPKGLKVLWREDDTSFGKNKERQKRWPKFKVTSYDEDGKPSGTVMRDAPRIM